MQAQFRTMILSFLISTAVWTFLTGGNFVAALMLMTVLAIHEFGHYFAAKYMGSKVELPKFIIIGAFVKFEDDPKTQRDNFVISAAGPLLGGIAAGIMFLLALNSGNPLLMKAATLGFLLNVFQLIPVPPFDGGHMVLPIHRQLWKVGAVFIVAYSVWAAFNGNFMLPVMVIMFWGGIRDYIKETDRKMEENPENYYVPTGERVVYALVYVALTAGLAFATWALGGF